MKKLVLAGIVVAAAAFASGGLAGQVVRWKPFATGSDSGQYSAFASASGSVPRPRALAVRATSSSDRSITVTYFYSCDGQIDVAPGKLVVLSIASAPKCTVNASAIANRGSVTITLLKAR